MKNPFKEINDAGGSNDARHSNACDSNRAGNQIAFGLWPSHINNRRSVDEILENHSLRIAGERGEDYIKRRYEEALRELRCCACTDTLRRQYEAVKASHAEIRDLRDHCCTIRVS